MLEWVPAGGRQPYSGIILGAKGQAANSLWSWGVPLAAIDAGTGEVRDLGVGALLSSESHAWNPSRPGLLAVAAGGSRYLFDPSRLTLVDVKSGQRQVLTPEGMAVYEPAWSPTASYWLT